MNRERTGTEKNRNKNGKEEQTGDTKMEKKKNRKGHKYGKEEQTEKNRHTQKRKKHKLETKNVTILGSQTGPAALSVY